MASSHYNPNWRFTINANILPYSLKLELNYHDLLIILYPMIYNFVFTDIQCIISSSCFVLIEYYFSVKSDYTKEKDLDSEYNFHQ